MRGIIAMLLGLFIFVHTLYDSMDGDFEVSTRSGGRIIYQVDNPSAYRQSVVAQALLGLSAIGLGFWVWRKDGK